MKPPVLTTGIPPAVKTTRADKGMPSMVFVWPSYKPAAKARREAGPVRISASAAGLREAAVELNVRVSTNAAPVLP
jgi:hypothetical protein